MGRPERALRASPSWVGSLDAAKAPCPRERRLDWDWSPYGQKLDQAPDCPPPKGESSHENCPERKHTRLREQREVLSPQARVQPRHYQPDKLHSPHRTALNCKRKQRHLTIAAV